MKAKHKVRKFGVVLVVIIALIVAVLNVNAEDKKDDTKTNDSSSNVQTNGSGKICPKARAMDKYELDIGLIDDDNYVTVTAKEGSFKIYEGGNSNLVDESGNVVKPNVNYADVILNYNEVKDAILTKDSPLKLHLDASKLKTNYDGTIEIVFLLAASDDLCDAGQYYEVLATSINTTSLEDVATKDNEQYNTLCRAIREGARNVGISNDVMDLYNADGLSFYKEYAEYCWNAKVFVSLTDSQVKDLISDTIESYYYVNYQDYVNTDTSFGEAFNASKNNACNATNKSTHCFEDIKSSDLTVKNLKCNSNYSLGNVSQEYTYPNITSYYGKNVTDYKVTYEYHKTGSGWLKDGKGNVLRTNYGSTEKEDKTVCKRVCEEAVDVEYGPPVASIAGGCFEYRVKVTSRVKCTGEVTPGSTPVKSKVCEPIPNCANRAVGAYHEHQGGPVIDFDQCVNECDGGKYTKQCSTKCYKKVYGSNLGKMAADMFEAEVEKMQLKSFQYSDTYQVNNGTICALGDGYARWYRINEDAKTKGDHGTYTWWDCGFKRRNYGGSVCGEVCSFKTYGCNSGYLNHIDVDYDYSQNLNAYNNAVKECKAAASCTTKTAEFTMSATYTDGDNKEITVDYPLSTKSTLDSVTSGTVSDKDKLLLDANKDTVIYDYNGCYNGPDARDFYQSEITFPGVWKNNKTQEISFQRPNNTKGWYLDKVKFCLPFDAQNVNVQWWNWYYNKLAEQNGDDNYYYESNEYSSVCDAIKNAKSYDHSKIKYNINADVKNFGYFGWNFNIKCFYALNNNPTTSPKDDANKCLTDPLNYSVRSVNNSNLFPDPDEAVSVGTDYSSTGRQPGFNWTSSATIPASKATTGYGTSDYYVNPELLIAKIQKRGDSIYNNDSEYLDYDFHLTPEMLNKLRDYNKVAKSYTQFNGQFYDSKDQISKYGLILYKSNLFNFSGSESTSTGYANLLGNVGGKYVRAVGNVGCNNDASGFGCESSSSLD